VGFCFQIRPQKWSAEKNFFFKDVYTINNIFPSRFGETDKQSFYRYCLFFFNFCLIENSIFARCKEYRAKKIGRFVLQNATRFKAENKYWKISIVHWFLLVYKTQQSFYKKIQGLKRPPLIGCRFDTYRPSPFALGVVIVCTSNSGDKAIRR